jgi:hypothetical protein
MASDLIGAQGDADFLSRLGELIQAAEPQPSPHQSKLGEALAPALLLYRRGKYGRAKARLGRIDKVYRADPLYVTFKDNLKRLTRRVLGCLWRKRDFHYGLRGNREAVQTLYFFLFQEDLREVKGLIGAGRFREAETVLWGITAFPSALPFTAFLRSCIMYGWMVHEDGSQNLSALKQARDLVLEASHGGVAGTGVLRNALEAGWAIEELRAIQKDIEHKSSSLTQFWDSYRRWRALSQQLSSISQQVRGSQASELMAQLADTLKRKFHQFDSKRAAAELAMANGHAAHLQTLLRNHYSPGLIDFKAVIQSDLSLCRGSDTRQTLFQALARLDGALARLERLPFTYSQRWPSTSEGGAARGR